MRQTLTWAGLVAALSVWACQSSSGGGILVVDDNTDLPGVGAPDGASAADGAAAETDALVADAASSSGGEDAGGDGDDGEPGDTTDGIDAEEPDAGNPDAVQDAGGTDGGGDVLDDSSSQCTPETCDDGDPCTVDACAGDTCTNTPTGECCDDADCPGDAVCFAGACLPPCEAAAAAGWHAGCRFFAVDLDQYDEAAVLAPTPGVPNPPDAPWGVAISNPGGSPAHLTFTAAEATLQAKLNGLGSAVVPPGTTKTWTLPSLDLAEPGIKPSAIRIDSDRPVTIIQHNPLDFAKVATTDSSLLLPAHLLGAEHFAASWVSTPTVNFGMTMPGQRATLTVVATAPGTTEVTVKPTVAMDAGTAAPLEPGKVATFLLKELEVLELQAVPPPMGSLTPGGDPTGTRIASDKPVAVFAGHEEAAIAPLNAADNCCADHLEEQLLPASLWGTGVIAAKTHPRANEPDLWRVVAGTGGATVSTAPPIPGLDGVTLAAGEHAEAFTTGTFAVSATGPVQVVQYTVGGQVVWPQFGDPSMIVAIPTHAFGLNTAFSAPASYTEVWLSVVRLPGATILLDDVPIAGGVAATAGGYELVYVSLSPGHHRLTGDQPFGAYLVAWHETSSIGHPLLLTTGP